MCGSSIWMRAVCVAVMSFSDLMYSACDLQRRHARNRIHARHAILYTRCICMCSSWKELQHMRHCQTSVQTGTLMYVAWKQRDLRTQITKAPFCLLVLKHSLLLQQSVQQSFPNNQSL